MSRYSLHYILLFRLSLSLLLLLSTCHSHEESLFPVITPVVGVLTQPLLQSTLANNNNKNETEYYVAASYLKWLEVAGARAIPIPYDASNDTVDVLFLQINGLLLPGGASDLLPMAVRRLWQLALRANEQGDYFPIWATCLGFEYMVMMASSQGDSILQSGFDAENISLALHNISTHSTLYADATIRNIVTHQNVTLNNHHMGIEPLTFTSDVGLTSMFRITSVNFDGNGRPFVSTVEPLDALRHPFYGVQYHPEKNAFEYGTVHGNIPHEQVNHSPDGIYVSVHLAQFFGKLLNKSRRHVYTFSEKYPLVYSYPMKHGLDFEQYFVIPSAKYWENEHVEKQQLESNSGGESHGSIAHLRRGVRTER